MANKEMNVRLKNRRDTLANWEAQNPVLLSGETAYVVLEGGIRQKTGDGKTAFKSLPYDDAGIYQTVSTLQESQNETAESLANLNATVTTLSGAVASKADSNHTHTPASIGAATSGHGHDIDDVTDLPNTLTKMAGDIAGKSDSGHTHTLSALGAAASSHSHSISNVTNLQASLDAKASASELSTHIASQGNPHGVTAAQTGALPLTGGTMTGEIKVGQGDGYGIQLRTDGRINATDSSGSTTCTLLGLSGTNTLLGHSSFNTTLRGKATRPTYNGSELSLLSDLSSHTANTTVHLTAAERTNWNAAYTHSTAAHAPSGAEVNQNAFSNVKVGSVTIAADSKTDTLTIAAGSNIQLAGDATNDVVTISATDTTYGAATTSANGLMTAAMVTKLNGIATGANAYSLPTASSSTLGGVKTTSTVTSASGYTACPIIGGVPYYKDTDTTYSLSSFGITATAAELNYCDGVTSNIQTQLNAKGSSSDVGSLKTRVGVVESQLDNVASDAAAAHSLANDAYNLADSKANASHGNHVPATGTANNAIFLRNDNTWQTVTPANIGAAATIHYHAASDITSGTLTVARGGTGVTSNPSMLINLASTSAASVFATSPRPGVTGTLPLGNGGTGATSASAARTNLSVYSKTETDSKITAAIGDAIAASY